MPQGREEQPSDSCLQSGPQPQPSAAKAFLRQPAPQPADRHPAARPPLPVRSPDDSPALLQGSAGSPAPPAGQYPSQKTTAGSPYPRIVNASTRPGSLR